MSKKKKFINGLYAPDPIKNEIKRREREWLQSKEAQDLYTKYLKS